MNSNDANSDLINELLCDAERSFTRLLFESPPLSVIETLADLVLHPDNGHNATLQCLYVWQDIQNYAYTLSSILDEVQNAQQVDIVCASLTLINRLMQHAPDSMKRIQIRRELEKIHFEEHLAATTKCFASNEQLRASSEKFSFLVHQPASAFITRVPILENFVVTDADSGTFSSEEDEAMNGTADERINGVADSDQKSNGEISNQINNLISSFDSADALELLAKLLKQLQEAEQPPTKVLKQLNESFFKLNEEVPTASKPINGVQINGVVPPPPPLLKNAKIPAPPPIQLNQQKTAVKGPPALPAFGLAPSTSAIKTNKVDVPQALKPKCVPQDGKKLRHLQWTKIPLNNLASTTADQNNSNVWLKMSHLSVDLLKNLDFGQLDSYFSCEPVVSDNQSSSTNEKEAKSQTVSLLCGKRSLSVNVFLKSLKGMVDELIAYIQNGQSADDGGVERLKMLVPLLPTEEELQTLKNYTGNKEELGTAECFLFKLLDVSDYKLRIEAIILREEFGAFISTIEPDLQTIIKACQELRQSRNLQTILLILLHMGNYLNHNAALGNAVGFKLASLWKIEEVRAIKGGRTLLHLVAQQAEKANATLDEISQVDDAAKLAFEALKSEIKTSVERVNKLDNQLKLKSGDLFDEMKTFLIDSKQRLERSTSLLTQIETERQQLSVYFCENEKTFSLEECFKILSNFRSKFIIASNENRQREDREKRMQEKNAPQINVESQPTISRPTVNETIQSPGTNRRATIIAEQDRDRNSMSSLLQSNRRKSSALRRDSAIFDKLNFDQHNENAANKSNDLSAFVDKALEVNSQRRSSRFLPLNSSLSCVKEFHETTNTFSDNKGVDEIKVPISTIDSQLNNQNIEPTTDEISNENAKPIEKPSSKVTSASLVSSVMSTRRTSNTAITTKNSPPLSRSTKTTLRKVPLTSTPKTTNEPPPKEDPASSPYRKQAISRIRARQSNESTQKPQPTASVQPLKPSQVRLAQSRLPNKSTPTNQSSTTSTSSVTSRLNKTLTTNNVNKVETKAPTNSALVRRSPPTTRSTASGRTSTSSTASSSRPPATSTNKEPASKAPMTATERRNLFRQNTSLSTTSRPTLIRSGSKPESKPRWS